VAPVRDVGNEEARILRSCSDFDGARVLEVGCGDGRLTWAYAPRATSVFGLDPDEESIAVARSDTPPELADRVRFEVGTAENLSKTAAFEVAFLSWSL
jgi:2-polyprenyl-6-hydroxyphenyl methylase / 3-demethylubiquinone-9 3-methyltransferase